MRYLPILFSTAILEAAFFKYIIDLAINSLKTTFPVFSPYLS